MARLIDQLRQDADRHRQFLAAERAADRRYEGLREPISRDQWWDYQDRVRAGDTATSMGNDFEGSSEPNAPGSDETDPDDADSEEG